jgi:hypothetical protein
LWRGYAQWSRLLTQLATEQRKTVSGNINKINRAEVLQRFAQSKSSPLTGLIYDMLRGESYMGEEINLDTENLRRQAYSRLMPLFFQDMIDAIDQEGILGMSAIPGAFGVGVVTYMSPAQKIRDQIAQERYQMTWEQVGKDPKLGIATQMDMERSNPQLMAEIQKEKDQYDKSITGKADINNIYRNHVETIEQVYRDEVNRAAEEFRETSDGYKFKEKVLDIASNRRANYNVLNSDRQFEDIVAKYDELPTADELRKLSPQDWARKWYMQMLYSDDMYDKYGNYRFDMVDDIKQQFINTFGQEMLDYVEYYQGVKESDMPVEYKMLRQAMSILKPYWQVEDETIQRYGEPKSVAQEKRINAIVSKIRKIMLRQNPNMALAYDMFYREK